MLARYEHHATGARASTPESRGSLQEWLIGKAPIHFRGKAAQHGLAGTSQLDPGKKAGSFRVRDYLQPGGACRLGHDPGCGVFPLVPVTSAQPWVAPHRMDA